MMSNIVGLAFEGRDTAKGWLNDLEKMAEDGHIEILDAVLVSRGVSDHVEMKQTTKLTGKYAKRGTGIGFLAGLLLGGPILGAVGGAAVGAITGSMKDIGIDDKFIADIAQGIGANSSMLFLMTQNADEKVIEYLRHFKARILTTTLPPEEEARLQKLLKSEEY
jgi:uncharacterized membrane protein